jgi:hypothetical protein
LEIAIKFFTDPHQVVMILRPSDSKQSLVRFFYRDSGGVLKVESSFCEFSVPPNFGAPLLVEGNTATEAPANAAQVAIAETGPPAMNGPALTVEEDDAVMELPAPPRVPRRRVSMVWPLVMATAVGTLAVWYWLTRPPERLALRVLDSGGQLRILWEPVPNGEAGNLEIADGGTRFSITLTPDQLRSGTLTYSRHSESVNVRLEALRRGAGPLAETAHFAGKNDAPAEPAPPQTGSASRDTPKLPGATPSVPEKTAEVVVSVPVAKSRAAVPKFSAPVPSVSKPANATPDLAPPPVIAESLPPSVPAVGSLNTPLPDPVPPKEPPAASRPSQAAPPRAAPQVQVTPASGRLIWIGHVQKNQEFWISGKSCSMGALIGELPGKPVKFSILPGEFLSGGIVLFTGNPQYANSVIESPGAQNGWSKTTYTWNPKYANDVVVKESPATQNQWNRIVLQSRNPRISVVVIDWTLVN